MIKGNLRSTATESLFQRVMLLFLLILFVAYEAIEVVFITTTPLEKFIFALFSIIFIITGMVGAVKNWKVARYSNLSRVLIFLCICAVFTPWFREEIDLYHYVRDVVSILTLLAAMHLINPASFIFRKRIWDWVVYSLIVVSVLSPTFSDFGRFEPPVILVTPYLFLLISVTQNKFKASMYLIVVFVFIALALASGQRTAFVLILVGSVLSLLLYQRQRTRPIIFVLILLASGFFIFYFDFSEFFLGSRFERLAGGRLDGSLTARLFEIEDVFITWKSLSLIEMFIGAGAGFLYDPLNIIANEKMLIDTEYRGLMRFHVHSTPAAVLLRFGLVGLGLFIMGTLKLIQLIGLSWISKNKFEMFFYLTLLLYIITGFFFYIPTDPSFLVFLACAYAMNKRKLEKG